MVDLFRPFVAASARRAVHDLLIPMPNGRLYIGQGARVDDFEAELRDYLASPQDVLTVNSCTSALDLALHLCGVGGQAARERSVLSPKRDVVISTPMTCTATNSPVVTRGGGIVWADVDPLTGLIDPRSVADWMERLWSEHNVEPSAIMAVDWGGHLPDYPALRESAALIGDHLQRVPIIQDAAHSFGATIDGIPFLDADADGARLAGDYVCFSFQAIKHLTTGDGGALVCPNELETERARLLRWYGLDRRSSQSYRCEQDIAEVGYKYHMNDIAATMGSENLPYMDSHIGAHRDNANFYGAVLHGLTGVLLPPSLKDGDREDDDAAWWLFTILVSDRDGFQAFMQERGIETSPVHARNDHHGAFLDAEFDQMGALPGLDFFAAHQVSIPVGWWLTTDERDQVAQAVIDWSRQHGRDLCVPTR
jgi:dTDP-4-amino-4,6-dideoxygalactose transaminase